MRQILAALLLALISFSSQGAVLPRGGPIGVPPPFVNNALYPYPQSAYTCTTNRFVNAATGSDSFNGTSQTFTSGTTGPWATIIHAESAMAGSNPGLCINVAAGTYNGVVETQAFGTGNNATGFAALRCAPNAATATARPYLFRITQGVQGSFPVCMIVNNAVQALGGVVAFGNGTSPFNYVIVDGFDISSAFTTAVNISALSYNSGTGLVTLTTATSPGLQQQMCFTIAGLTGTGSIGSANGYFCAAAATNGTTTTYNIGVGLTLAYTSGGTLTYPSGSESGIGPGENNINPGAHHAISINNYVHDIGGGGFQAGSQDSVVWAGNVIQNTAWQNVFDESGMSMVVNVAPSFTASTWDGILGSVPTSSSTSVPIRNLLVNNWSSNNGNLAPNQTDGNGIILDTVNNQQTSCTTTSYNFGTLVYGNVVAQNGGHGIHVFFSNNTAVLNNTAFSNNQSVLQATQLQIDSTCSSNGNFRNNISVAITGSGTLASNYALGGVNSGATFGVNNAFHNNIANIIGTPTNCGPLGVRGNGTACWNSFDTIFNPALSITTNPVPIAWASGTTYAQFDTAIGSDGNIYVSLAGSNTANNPVTDTSNCSFGVGAHWQCNGLPDNSYPTDPKFTLGSQFSPPNLVPQSGSPAINASTQAVTALGGPTVATPNIGAW